MRCEVCFHGTALEGKRLCSACISRGKKAPRKKREAQEPKESEPKE